MISLADFQPFFTKNRGFTERYFSDKVHAFWLKRYRYKLRCVTALTSLKGQYHELRMRDFLPLGALTQ